MKQLFKSIIAASAVVALAGTAEAIPTLTISDGINSITVSSASGAVTYDSTTGGSGWLADNWNIVITTGTSYPPLIPGNASFPALDLGITATSLGNAGTLTITFFGTDFGPTTGAHAISQMTGHTITGIGGAVTFNTFYSTANNGAATTAITSASMSGPSPYNSLVSGGSITGNPYSLTEVVTINGSNAAKYSLDASVTTVPDGGTTLVLLGSALSGLALLRKKLA